VWPAVAGQGRTAHEEQLDACLDRVTRCDEADAVLVVLVPTALAEVTGDDLVRAVTGAVGRRSKPVVLVRLEQPPPVEPLPASGRSAYQDCPYFVLTF
jgi:succinyl-CoA synthetase beta subunit